MEKALLEKLLWGDAPLFMLRHIEDPEEALVFIKQLHENAAERCERELEHIHAEKKAKGER